MVLRRRTSWLAFALIALLLVACPQSTGPGSNERLTAITVTGKVEFDSGGSVEGASVRAGTADVSAVAFGLLQSDPEGTTDVDGRFSLVLEPRTLPARVVLSLSTDVDGVRIDSAKTLIVDSANANFGTIFLPNPEGAEIPVASGAGQNSDGSIRVAGLPDQIAQLYGRSYDPDETPEAFPGEFAENGQIPLDSANFLWMEALDADGNPVDDLGQAAVIRSRVPASQWADLEDLVPGSDRIEVPMYTFNETSQVWEQMDETGWLEDGSETVLPEDAQSVILDGSFAGDIFATFRTEHFSWMNVDYAYIGPWRLSLLTRERRNNDCLYNALQLARTIALSDAGRAAFAKVNEDGADLAAELADNAGPSLKDSSLEGKYGVYSGDAGGHEDRFEIADWIWNGCGEGASERQKKDATLILAVTILHETAHWKDDNKKHPDDDTDTPGEEGNQLERDLFGGIVTNSGGIRLDGNPVPNATVDGWLDPASWTTAPESHLRATQSDSPLDLAITLPKTSFVLGEEVPVTVTIENTSDQQIEVLDLMVLEGYPLHFVITDEDSGERVLYLGPEFKLELTDSDFTTLGPGETLMATLDLLRDPDGGSFRYKLLSSGTYRVRAVYESFRGVPETTSNSLLFAVGSGGSLAGRVTSATSGEPIEGGLVRVYDASENLIDSATTDANGEYAFPEFLVGTFTVRASASGFLTSTRENISVAADATSIVDFSLSQLLSAGQLRLVLRWGTGESDLDSHLWLPAEMPYHVFYGRRGFIERCPFAALDLDDTSYEGPETVTIAELHGPGEYHYAIHNFSNSGPLSESGAEVQVFDSSGLLATFAVPDEGSGTWWHVLTIDGDTGAITEVDTIGADPSPYASTSAGCSEVAAALQRVPGASGKVDR